MSKIHVLSSDVSNKIAAGEVVERPASVIKELIENSIDAGSSKITIEIKNGGIEYIRVTDNGLGMDYDDAKTAFLRHATSKISTEDDLEKINTLGFRGEALASIAAVSNVELMTKTQHANGVFIELHAGVVIKNEVIGCPDGTTIVIKNLFYNTPARMKFLKTNKTETGYITDIVERLILGNPTVSIKYIVDGKEKLFFSGDGDIKSCVYSVYGRDYAKNILDFKRNENKLSIFGVVGKAETSRGNRAFQSFYVNGRYVKNKRLTYAVESAYRNILMTGKYPFFIININIPYDLVDINVHPTKQEVKFADEKTVYNEVYWAVKNALSVGADEIREEIKINKISNFNSFEFEKQHTQIPLNMPKNNNTGGMAQPIMPFVLAPTIDEAPQKSYKLIGQIFDTYIIIEIEGKIILIDQHAAHERMIYEKLLSIKNNTDITSQLLISPIAVTLSSKEYSQVEANIDLFKNLGFEIEDFGNNSILVRQTPVDIGEENIKALILELINNIKIDEVYNSQALYKIACVAAVKANNKLSTLEIDALVQELIKTGGINTCPHGRPLMITLTKHELEKMFKRVQ